MPVIKVAMVCEICGKKYTRSKSRANEHSRCRSCNMKKTYAEKPYILEKALERRKETCKKVYGVDNVARNKDIQDKWRKTKLDRYGNTGAFQNKDLQLRAEELAHSEEAENKRKETCLEKYGAEHHMKNKDIAKKMSETYEKITGYKSPLQNPEVKLKMVLDHGQIGRVRGYTYKDIHFDSSWELAYYIWLEDNNKKFIYRPKYFFEYIGDDGKTHLYCPDFLVEGTFYEIKGSQFFNERGEPFNFYTKTFWWDKYNKLKHFGVVILTENDMKPYVTYVNKTYGSTFLKQLKNK